MNTKTAQSRTIKVERAGDAYRRKTFPKIRLQGKWLEELGFPPCGRVEVVQIAPGEIHLKFQEEQAEGYVLNEKPSEYGPTQQLDLL